MVEPEIEQSEILRRRISRRTAIKAGGVAAVGLAFSKPVIETIYPRPAFAQMSPIGKCAVVNFSQPGIITGPDDISAHASEIYTSKDPIFDCSDCGPEKCFAEDVVENWRLVDENDVTLATTSFSNVPGVTLEDGFAASGKNEKVKVIVDGSPMVVIHLTSDRVVICVKENCEPDTKKMTSEPLTITAGFHL